MRALLYLTKRSMINNLKKAVKKPLTLLVVLACAAYAVFLAVMLAELAVQMKFDRLKLEGAVVGWKQVPDSDFTVKNLRKARKKHEQPSERTTAGRAASGTMSENHSTEHPFI